MKILLQRKKLNLGVLLLAVIFLLSCTPKPTLLHDLQGHEIDMNKLRGHWTVVNYWAGWCSGCMKEIPELNAFYDQYKDSFLQIYGVNFDNLPEGDLRNEAVKHDIHYPVLVQDPDEAWHLGTVEVLPTTFILDPEGKVVAKMLGPQTVEALSEQLKLLRKG